jgi:hypothetical protein
VLASNLRPELSRGRRRRLNSSSIEIMQWFKLHPLLALRTVTFQCLLNGVEQVLVAERLGEKLDGPGFHRLHHREQEVLDPQQIASDGARIPTSQVHRRQVEGREFWRPSGSLCPAVGMVSPMAHEVATSMNHEHQQGIPTLPHIMADAPRLSMAVQTVRSICCTVVTWAREGCLTQRWGASEDWID